MDKNSGRKQPFCFVTFKDDIKSQRNQSNNIGSTLWENDVKSKPPLKTEKRKLPMVPGAIKTISKQNAVMIFIAILIEISKVGFQ